MTGAIPLDVSTLLSGPSGRRLCLAFAHQDQYQAIPGAAELWQLLFSSTHRLESARGQGGTFFGWGVDEPLPDPSVEEIAEALDSIPLTPLDTAEALHALAVSFDLMVEQPHGAATVDSAIQGLPLEVPTPPPAGEVLRLWRERVVEGEQLAIRERPSDPAANLTGEWWSKPPSALTATTRSLPQLGPVGLWLIEDRFDQEPADVQRVTFQNAPRVCEITGAESWAELCLEYPLDVTATRRHDWYCATGRKGRWIIPDWSQVARDFDAVHLSLAAYVSAVGTFIALGEDSASVIAGWNPDETYWLTDVSSQPATRTSWMRDEESERWHEIAAR